VITLSNPKSTGLSRRNFLSVSASVAAVSTLALGSKFSNSISPFIPSVYAQSAAQSRGISNIYSVGSFQGVVNGHHDGLNGLFSLMGSNGLYLLKSSETGSINSPDGLIGSDDIVLIKNNCQWGERGGTNTDLVRELIYTIDQHPDGFNGEIVVVDNGQGRGSFNWDNANAEDTTQCIQDVVDSFNDEKISTFLWDTIRGNRVQEYDQGNIDDGYVHEADADPLTGMRFNYPKFQTSFGTYISLKKGIWNPVTQTYSNDNLKLINFPVIKSHSGAGVTACIKHYMGFVSQSIQNNHNYIYNGGLAATMAKIRFPVLNILDAIHINPHPKESGNAGPDTPYSRALKMNKIAASTDPVALDYWASKNILMPATKSLGYTSYSSMNPDNTSSIIHDCLTNSQSVLTQYGYQSTMTPSEIVVNSSYLSNVRDIPDLNSAPENCTYFVYPDYQGSKPNGTQHALLSDWTAAGYIVGMCGNKQIETTDTNPQYIDPNTGAINLQDSTIVLFGGPIVNAPLRHYESRRLANLYWTYSNGVNCFYRADGTRLDATALSSTDIDSGQDLFVVESFIDENRNKVLAVYGYGWKGTFAGGKFFKFIIYPNISNYTDSYYVYKWIDSNGNGFVDLDEVDTTAIAQG